MTSHNKRYLGVGVQMQSHEETKNNVLDDIAEAALVNRHAEHNVGVWGRSCFNMWDVNEKNRTCRYKDFLEKNERCKPAGFNCFSGLYHREALLEAVAIMKSSFAKMQRQDEESDGPGDNGQPHAVSACSVAYELAKKGYVTRATLHDLVFASSAGTAERMKQHFGSDSDRGPGGPGGGGANHDVHAAKRRATSAIYLKEQLHKGAGAGDARNAAAPGFCLGG